MPMFHQHDGFLGGYGGHGVGPLELILMVLFWAAIALLLVALVKNYRHGPHHLHDHLHGLGTVPPSTTNPAVDILKERFARGEVNEEEFTRRLSLLKEV